MAMREPRKSVTEGKRMKEVFFFLPLFYVVSFFGDR